MRSIAFLLAVAVVATGCASSQTASYLVTVHDRNSGAGIEGATIEVRGGAGTSVVPSASGITDGRGESVVVVPGWSGADLFVTFDGDTERYWFPPIRTPGYEAPKEEISGERSTLRFISGASGTPAWKVGVVRLKNQNP